jgi:hypothetical protein
MATIWSAFFDIFIGRILRLHGFLEFFIRKKKGIRMIGEKTTRDGNRPVQTLSPVQLISSRCSDPADMQEWDMDDVILYHPAVTTISYGIFLSTVLMTFCLLL